MGTLFRHFFFLFSIFANLKKKIHPFGTTILDTVFWWLCGYGQNRVDNLTESKPWNRHWDIDVINVIVHINGKLIYLNLPNKPICNWFLCSSYIIEITDMCLCISTADSSMSGLLYVKFDFDSNFIHENITFRKRPTCHILNINNYYDKFIRLDSKIIKSKTKC